MLLRIFIIYSFLMAYGISAIQAQKIYLRTYQPRLNQNSFQLPLPNGDFIVAGNVQDSTSAQKLNLLVSRFNPCGDVIWSKQFEYANEQVSLDVVGLELGANNKILIAGNMHLSFGRNLFLMRLNVNGSLDFFKRFNTGTADIAYSMDISPTKEIYLFFNANVGEVGPNNDLSLIKLDTDANLIWYKQLGFSWIWGHMSATSDGGVLISNNMELFKMDAAGNMSWTKSFNKIEYSQHHFELPTGYAFFKYHTSQNHAYPLMINKNGSIKWVGQRIPNFQPQKGILRSNGNLLYVGKLSQPGIGGSKLTFLEIDTSNGNILNVAMPYHQVSANFIAYSLHENADSSITFSGNEHLSLVGGLMLGRVNKQLNSISCLDTLLSLNYPPDTLTVQPASNRTVNNASISIEMPSIVSTDFALQAPTYFCAFKTPLSMDLGKDTILCPGNSLVLQSNAMEYDFYLWSTGETSKSIKVDTAGTYWLRGILDCDTIIDSINVSYHSLPEFELGPDTSICPGQSLVLDAGGHLATWSTGETAQSISVSGSGMYWAEVQSTCGPVRDSIQINVLQPLQSPFLGNDTLLCFGSSLQLSVDPGYEYIKWSTAETTPDIQVGKGGEYTVTVANACDTLSDTIQVEVLLEIVINADVQPKVAKVLDSIYFVQVEPKDYASLLWEFGDGAASSNRSTTHAFSHAGKYTATLKITDKHSCSAIRDFEILINNHDYVVPNVFTPNGDGINDEFGVFGEGISNVRMEIYNRWGNRIYTSNSIWDGRSISGENAASGVYFYLLSFDQIGRETQKLQGEISLLR